MTITTSVSRKRKAGTKAIKLTAGILAVVFLLAGILFSRGFFLPCFLMAGLYFVYEAFSERDYEYIYGNGRLRIDVIIGRRFRRTEHELDLQNLKVVAPHDHEAVDAWRKGSGTEQIPKFDYTSYDDNVPYYTMIIYEDRKLIKILLDLDEAMLAQMKRDCPERVYR
jgi:hypothetical protein